MFVTPGTCDSTPVTAFTQLKQVMPVIASVVAPSMVSYDPDRPAFFLPRLGLPTLGSVGIASAVRSRRVGKTGLSRTWRGRSVADMRRLAPVLVAFLFALAAMLPAAGPAMPMQMGPMTAGMAGAGLHKDCADCPHAPRTGTAPDRMQACQIMACAAAVAVLPAPAWLPSRVLTGTAHPRPSVRAWAGAQPAPDPLPPRPIALV